LNKRSVQQTKSFTGLGFFLVSLVLSACGSAERLADSETARKIGASGGLQPLELDATPFVLTAYARVAAPGKALSVFIEGDGFAWRTPTQPSPNPTPNNPLALRLAAKTAELNPQANILYLARPCQYTTPNKNPACNTKYWTNQRYAEEVVAATDTALNKFVRIHNIVGIHLLGYSGGAGLAALVAVRRNDVLSFRSVAGNLDPATLNAYHHVSPLIGSLDPIQTAPALSKIPQIHWIGSADVIVPSAVSESWVKYSAENLSSTTYLKIERVSGATHSEGWLEFWTKKFTTHPTEALGK
jgi:hypothetical protein